MRILTVFFLLCSVAAWAQKTPPAATEDISGMYSFLREGEFVQVNVDDGRVTGFVSRYADEEKNRANFVDQFFDKASLDGKQLTFTTKTVQGVHYDFKGTVERGRGKVRSDEEYFVLKGTLTQYAADPSGKIAAQSRQVELKSFPGDVEGSDAPQ